MIQSIIYGGFVLKKIEVSAAILIKNDLICCAQRGEGKYDYICNKFEFPGGKIEKNECPKDTLHRELLEEMELFIDVNDMMDYCVVDHQYPDFHVTLHCFICHINDNQTFILKEHQQVVWSDRNSIETLDWAAADIPIVQQLKAQGY